MSDQCDHNEAATTSDHTHPGHTQRVRSLSNIRGNPLGYNDTIKSARNNQQTDTNQGHQPPNGPSLRSWQRPLQEGLSGAKAAQTHEAAGFFTSSIRAHFTAS